jgi:hypothetical protein
VSDTDVRAAFGAVARRTSARLSRERENSREFVLPRDFRLPGAARNRRKHRASNDCSCRKPGMRLAKVSFHVRGEIAAGREVSPIN